MAMARLVKSSHERPGQQRILGRTALSMFHSLLDAGVIEIERGRAVVNADLQEDFSLNHALSLYLLHAIELLDRESPAYALDLLTLVESILENPDLVLLRQLDKLKMLKLAELKAQGVEYDDRMAELEKLEYPKPNREFVYDTFNAFAREHPWVGTDNIRPKSVAREMFEMFFSFPEYVKEYGLERGEGVLLRYLSDAYKTLVQSVPERAKTPDVDDIVTYFGAIVRAVDSSLLDEWEQRRGGVLETGPAAPQRVPGEADITRNPRELTVLVRNAVFGLVRALSRRDYALAASLVEPGEWSEARLAAAFSTFFSEHAAIRLDPPARAPENTRISTDPDGLWRVQQILLDPEDHNDWALDLTLDLVRTGDAGKPVLTLVDVVR